MDFRDEFRMAEKRDILSRTTKQHPEALPARYGPFVRSRSCAYQDFGYMSYDLREIIFRFVQKKIWKRREQKSGLFFHYTHMEETLFLPIVCRCQKYRVHTFPETLFQMQERPTVSQEGL